MMPGEDGLSVCRRLRAAGDLTQIVVLTARGDPIDHIVGLETGADDYLPKPFEPRELVARLTAVLRRTRGMRAMPSDEDIAVASLEIDLSTRTVKRDSASLELSRREFALLEALLQSRGCPLSRAQLIERPLGRDAEVTDRAVDVHIARLRRAIGDRSDSPELIKTIWGVGYVLVSDGACLPPEAEHRGSYRSNRRCTCDVVRSDCRVRNTATDRTLGGRHGADDPESPAFFDKDGPVPADPRHRGVARGRGGRQDSGRSCA